jgi:hypothetical protein
MKRGRSHDRAAILRDFDPLREAHSRRGVITKPGLPMPEVIAEIRRRHGFPSEAACIEYLGRLRDEIEEAHCEEIARVRRPELPGDPIDI